MIHLSTASNCLLIDFAVYSFSLGQGLMCYFRIRREMSKELNDKINRASEAGLLVSLVYLLPLTLG